MITCKQFRKLLHEKCLAAAGLKMAVAFAGNSTAIQEMFKRHQESYANQ